MGGRRFDTAPVRRKRLDLIWRRDRRNTGQEGGSEGRTRLQTRAWSTVPRMVATGAPDLEAAKGRQHGLRDGRACPRARRDDAELRVLMRGVATPLSGARGKRRGERSIGERDGSRRLPLARPMRCREHDQVCWMPIFHVDPSKMRGAWSRDTRSHLGGQAGRRDPLTRVRSQA